MICFSSKAAATITMFEKDALQLLKLMEMSGNVPSAISADDIPAALKCLTKSLSQSNENNSEDEEDEENVSVDTRAYPLIQMLKKAHEENESVMWDYD